MPLSGWAAAAAAILLIAYERGRAANIERRELRAAHMQVVSELSRLITQCIKIVEDIDNYEQSDGNTGTLHSALPIPMFWEDARQLTDLPEAEGLLAIARRILDVNNTHDLNVDLFGMEAAVFEIRRQAARAAETLIEKHDALAMQLGWSLFQNNESTLERIHDIATADDSIVA